MYLNKKIRVNIFRVIEYKKEFIGVLKKFNNENIEIEVENKILNIERKNISQIRAVYDWE